MLKEALFSGSGDQLNSGVEPKHGADKKTFSNILQDRAFGHGGIKTKIL